MGYHLGRSPHDVRVRLLEVWWWFSHTRVKSPTSMLRGQFLVIASSTLMAWILNMLYRQKRGSLEERGRDEGLPGCLLHPPRSSKAPFFEGSPPPSSIFQDLCISSSRAEEVAMCWSRRRPTGWPELLKVYPPSFSSGM